jgi:arabinofuranosyltransferase
VASRLRLDERGRPGHEKVLPTAWTIARFAHPGTPDALAPEVTAARQALACRDLAALRDAVEAPLTAGRLARNAALAWRLHRLRVPPAPAEAAAALCPPP